MEKTGETTAKPVVSKKAVLIVSAIASFLTPFMGSSINIALPRIQEQFSLGGVALSWVATSYLLAAAVGMVPLGRLADIYGRKKILIWGMGVFALGSIGCGLSFSASMLIALRVLQGIGASMIFATGLAIITSVFPPGERGRAIGVSIAAVYIGLSLGPVLGGLLTEHLGWRSIFLLSAVFGVLNIFLIAWKIQSEWAGAKGERFDFIGALIFGLAIIALIVGLTGLLPNPMRTIMAVAGIAGVGIFIWLELRIDSPVFQIRLFKDSRVFAFSNLAALLHYSSTYGVVFLMSLYLQYIKGFTPQQAGAVLVIQPVMMAAFSPLAGRLSDKVEPVLVASVGLALTASGLFLLSRVGMESSIVYLIVSFFVLGLGFALFSSPNTNAIMSSVPKKYLGIAGGAVSTMRLIGQMTSMGISTMIFSLVMGSAKIEPDIYPQFLWSVKTALTVFGVLCVCGIGASLVRGKVRENTNGPGKPA